MRGLVVLWVGLAGCLDFEPGTPDPNNNKPDLAQAPSQQPKPDLAVKPAMPGADMTVAPLGNLVCEANLAITGTYVQGSAPPVDFPGGCWPDGTWTFTVSITSNNCTSGPPLESPYVFKVVEDLDYNDTITYQNDPNNLYITTKISGGEGAVCTGSFKIFSADGKTVTNLRPAMQADLTLNGVGDIRVYDADQRF